MQICSCFSPDMLPLLALLILITQYVKDFLITIAEPISRPAFLHEYKLTTHSLHAAVSVGLQSQDIIDSLERLMNTEVPENVAEYIRQCGQNYGKVKLVLRNKIYFLETTDLAILQQLLKTSEISGFRKGAHHLQTAGVDHAAALREAESLIRQHHIGHDPGTGIYSTLMEEDDDNEESQKPIHAFHIQDDQVSNVAERCLQLGLPILEEYDFRDDTSSADLDIDLRPSTKIRPYQEKSLSKVFGNGRAKSGIIVLPCGAGKTLVGITVACTIKKGVIILATSNLSALQWRSELLKWSTIHPDDIAIFSSDHKSTFSGSTGIIVTTYSMVTNPKDRSDESSKMMHFLQSRDWGLMILGKFLLRRKEKKNTATKKTPFANVCWR